MMDVTDRHCRYLLRLIGPRTRLYTEMLTTGAVLHGDRARLLGFDPAEHPVALQLGGSEPEALAEAARIGADRGYDEINLNVGCPSDRVQSGRFGACLMAEPELVADGVRAMREATSVPVTVKTRIGIDDKNDYGFLVRFTEAVRDAGCRVLIVHARKAWLSGLSPKENREVPPLRYEVVHRLGRDFPDLTVVLNGGLRDPAVAAGHLAHLDGVMIGREAWQNPWSLAGFEQAMLGAAPALDRHAVMARMLPYIERQRARGVPLKVVTRPMLGLFNGLPGARAWRRHLSERAHLPGAGPEVVEAALRHVQPARAA
jgi:tRNA-dihydrouridine synthase A